VRLTVAADQLCSGPTLSTLFTLEPILAVPYIYFLLPQAFTRTVQQEPDNGDAWANIAAVHLQHRTWRPAFVAAAEVRLPAWAAGPTGALIGPWILIPQPGT
jgi:hypothetical protein